jgi:hypothetical protein
MLSFEVCSNLSAQPMIDVPDIANTMGCGVLVFSIFANLVGKNHILCCDFQRLNLALREEVGTCLQH